MWLIFEASENYFDDFWIEIIIGILLFYKLRNDIYEFFFFF
jgi:hypothetical protein